MPLDRTSWENHPFMLKEPDKSEKFNFRYEYGLTEGGGTNPGCGLKLLLLCEKFEWVKTRFQSLTFGHCMPSGKGIGAKEVEKELGQERIYDWDARRTNENDLYNNYD